MTNFKIDPEAKSRIPLERQLDKEGHAYFIGKLQFPGTLEFDKGASFMVFLSDEGCEELHIAPLDPSKRNKSQRDGAGLSGGRFSIDLHSKEDRDGNIYYIGEALGPVVMKLRRGIFFHIFTSRPGYEEVQISQLNHNHPKKERNRPVKIWPAKIYDTI